MDQKREPVSDIDIAVADSLKVLDLKRPIREATEIARRCKYIAMGTTGDQSRCSNVRETKLWVYSITSSARASRLGATSRPSDLAVLRLITSSYLLGCCTGKSAGFSPLRMRST
jgi:hypothetical protein